MLPANDLKGQHRAGPFFDCLNSPHRLRGLNHDLESACYPGATPDGDKGDETFLALSYTLRPNTTMIQTAVITKNSHLEYELRHAELYKVAFVLPVFRSATIPDHHDS